MCEYCGCQNVDVIAELTAEHDALRDLGRELGLAADAGDLVRAGDLARRMLAVLGPHTAVEEGGLFPALADQFAEPIAALVDEHRAIEPVLTGLAAGTPTADWPTSVHTVLNTLFEHILKEQDGVFPAALAMLSAADWDAVASARRAEVGT
ncbi:MAG TPA: hemerythrin domain-containing protein [Jatrophihabitans sp.]|nr:hemerythrin domain-containing protein [Jatrophihabitans sp.]